jgi:hypothetical protein
VDYLLPDSFVNLFYQFWYPKHNHASSRRKAAKIRDREGALFRNPKSPALS